MFLIENIWSQLINITISVGSFLPEPYIGSGLVPPPGYERCAVYERPVAPGETKTLQCKEPIPHGYFVLIQLPGYTSFELLKLCSVKIYGGKILIIFVQ